MALLCTSKELRWKVALAQVRIFWCKMPKLHCVPVPVPACPCTVLAIPSCYQTSLDCAGRNTTSSSPEQLISDSWRWAKPVSPHDSEKGMVFPKCVILNQYPCGSSGLPNPIEGFGDATLWRSCVPRYRPQRQPMTRQLNNEFKNSRWDFGWHDCHFALKLLFMHSESTQLTVFDTNATHCFWSN